MLSFRWLAIGAGIASFSAGVAIAGSQSGETTAVTADFQAAVVSQKQRQCDANHVSSASSSRARRQARTSD